MENKEQIDPLQPGIPTVYPLWTRDFTIITLGTVVSMLGSAVSGFAIGLLVLDYTDSVLLYALYQVFYCLPRIVLPLVSGPYLDRFSRKKVIYTLDFTSSALFFAIFFVIRAGYFNYAAFVVVAMVIGGIDSVYSVAYDSFYPTLISKGNFSRAYSISSLIYPLANTIMVPIAGVCYRTIGLAPLFLFNAATFLVAAIFETQIKAVEQHQRKRAEEHFSLSRYIGDFKDGLSYLRVEKGLGTITLYFFVTTLCSSVASTLFLPYFKGAPGLGVDKFTLVMAISTVGRLIGGFVHYKYKYPPAKKFAIAIFVYLTLSALEGTFLFAPFAVMMLFQLLVGLLGVTSFNIRISGTQNYLNDDMRGRFNGVFQMLNFLGGILGQLIAGVLGDAVFIPYVVAGAMLTNVIAVFAIMLPGAKHVKRIYNVEA